MGANASYSIGGRHSIRSGLNQWQHMMRNLGIASHDHAVYVLDRATPCPWMAKIDGQFFPAKYLFTVDYTTLRLQMIRHNINKAM